MALVTDVCVFGATAAGVAAAAGAAEAGAEVVLVERGAHIGGMVSGGLSWTDVGDVRVLGGFARRFYALVAEHYGAPLWSLRGPEPHVAESILESLLARVDVRLGTDLLADAAVYVDASYEGDLLPRFGIPYRVGRESRVLHGEVLAGRQPATRPGKHNFPVRLSPHRSDGTLLPHIRPPELDEYGWPVDEVGAGDGGLQAYGFRVCLTTAGQRIPFAEPAGYDETEFELLDRLLAAASPELPDLLGLVRGLLPNDKCDVNSIGPFSLNVLDGSNRDYPDGDAAARERVRAHHLAYTQRFLWFLTTRFEEMRQWGLCPDEFTDTGGWPHQLYVREARRMVGETVLCEHDLRSGAFPEDTIALGSYNIDIREVERTWRVVPEFDREDVVFNEGYLSVAVPAYGIPYRLLTPRRADADNVLVPVCCSASHIAFGSVRMEPTLDAARSRCGPCRRASRAPQRRGAGRRRPRIAGIPSRARPGARVILGAIADDFTGATDLCAALARAGLRPLQVIGSDPVDLPECDALVIALKSRTAPVAEAVDESRRAVEWLMRLGAEHVFFKYCSTFDSFPHGNIGPVADALLDALGEDFAVVCPAYPANGRTVYLGHLFVNGRLLSESSVARHPLTPMIDADLVRVLSRQTPRRVSLVPYEVVAAGAEAIAARFAELRREGVTYAVADAVGDDALHAIAAACAGHRLMTGAAGLGEAVAAGLAGGVRASEQPRPAGPAAVVAGSCSEATMAQVERMAAEHTAFKLDPQRDDVAAVARAAAAALADGPVLVYSTATPDEVARVQRSLGADAGGEVEKMLGEVARTLVRAGVERLVVAGGETSAAVVQALGLRLLRVGAEVTRGVPWMTTVEGRPLALALKSGNFGGPDFFLEAIA